MDAIESQTDVLSFSVLEPKYDGFRNYWSYVDGKEEFHLVDKAALLTLSLYQLAAAFQKYFHSQTCFNIT